MPRHLPLARLAADLPHCLHDLLATTGAGRVQLSGGKLSTVSVYREVAFVGGVVAVQEVANLTLGAEARILEAHGLQDGVSVIEIGKLHIFRTVPRLLKG